MEPFLHGVQDAFEQYGEVADQTGKTLLDYYHDAVGGLTQALEQGEGLFEELQKQASETMQDLASGVNELSDGISDTVNDWFTNAFSWQERIDPLTLDLDADGLETQGTDVDDPVLFDHNGDGVKRATGWIKPDDAFLALDRNGNGTIDTGAELFGDNTPLVNGDGDVTGVAEDGFEALRDQDTNGDGVVNSEDANWDELRVWRDLDSDGVTDEGELQGLDEAGIASFSVEAESNNQLQDNGNVVADLGTYQWADGSTGTVGQVTGEMADIDLTSDPFHREFSDEIPLTEEAEDLPRMRGSGDVRDLREAASLSSELASVVADYAAAPTKADQEKQLDGLLDRWADTAEAPSSLEQADSEGYELVYLPPGQRPEDAVGAGGTATEAAERERVTRLIETMEAFNGRSFVEVGAEGVETGAGAFIEAGPAPSEEDGSGGEYAFVELSSAQVRFLERSKEALGQSVYDGLLMQTRLKPYLDGAEAGLDEEGLTTDFSGTEAAFQQRFEEAPDEAVRDLLDMQRVAGSNMAALGWDGLGQLRGWLSDAASGDGSAVSELTPALAEFGYPGLAEDGQGSHGSEAVIGPDDGGVLRGRGGDDLVLGGPGDDILSGGSGDDTLYGGRGDDTYRFGAGDGSDTIYETHGESGEDELAFGSEVPVGEVNIRAEGDRLVFDHIGGQDSVAVENWFNSLSDAKHRLDRVSFEEGGSYDLDSLQLGGEGSDTLEGSSDDGILVGGEGEDTLEGGTGSELLHGGAGADHMAGGEGDDTYVVDHANDEVVEQAGEGEDTVHSRVDHGLSDHVENLRLVGESAIDGAGNTLDNRLAGNDAANTLQGGAGNDTLIGNGGDDLLDGGVGVDTLAGGTGDDTYVVDSQEDVVTEQAGEGEDTVRTHLDYRLGDNVENLTLTGEDSVAGTGNELDNEIRGNSEANTLTGNGGDDLLDGGAGADTMAGGTGDDTYVVDSQEDVVTEHAGEGEDTVRTHLDYRLGDHVENLTLTGEDSVAGTGNELDNEIRGNRAANTLTGNGGDDLLDGGAAADTMAGGTGDDTYVVGEIGDDVQEEAGEGTDTVRSGITYTLVENTENLVLTGYGNIDGTGNAADNVLRGNRGDNTLDGGAGSDHLAGSGGDDTYILNEQGDTVSEEAGQGHDTVVSPFDYTLGENVEDLTLTGEAETGTGNALDNRITGTDADNRLDGGKGDDTLNGGAGGDHMTGGEGDDTYIVDQAADTPIEEAAQGEDTVRSSLSWELRDNLENLILTGEEDTSGTGNELANEITGNAGDNTLTGNGGDDRLDGGAGADAMAGGSGNDTYVVDDAGDTVTEAAGEGTDTAEAGIDYTLTENVENLTLTGSEDLVGTGNELDNRLTGNGGDNTLFGKAGADHLDGGAGADTLAGGTGDDTYIVDNPGDTIEESAGEGDDLVRARVSHALDENVERLGLTGKADIDGSGNALDNTVTGNAGDNRLDGGAGADEIAGGEGDDTYVVDNEGDVVTEAEGEGTDTVESGIDYTLTDNVENLVLTGDGDISGTGNGLDNEVIGNAAANTLRGGGGNDTLSGGEGDDLLDGGAGADSMAGGSGNDTYVVDEAGDEVTEKTDEGEDTVLSGISYTLGENVENLILTGESAEDGTGNELDNELEGNNADNHLSGKDGNDVLSGGDGADHLEGGSGADTLYGGRGADLLDGGSGVDRLEGGVGDDTYRVDHADDAVVEEAGAGTDTVYARASYSLGAHVENLTLEGWRNLDGTGNDQANELVGNRGANTLRGGGGADTLRGGRGNDRLDGGSGADAMYGGTGNDTYVVDDAGDRVVEEGGAGRDTVESSIDYTLTDHVEDLTLTGSEGLEGTGNALNNRITGNDGSNTLSGKGGRDTIRAGDGADVLNGGEGNDRLYGQAGADELHGGAGADLLDGGSGADAMAGGTGNDTYVVDDAGDEVTEAVGEGTDTVRSSITYTLTENVENLTLTGAAAIDGTGNDLANRITGNSAANELYGLGGNDRLYGRGGDDVLNGGDGDDRLYGQSGADELHGGSGADLLDGGSGLDRMEGGAGDDTYRVDHSDDEAVEAAGAGTDTVYARASYTLGAHVEHLTLEGWRNLDGTGNGLGNELTGNRGSNTLKGLAGADTLRGGRGGDTLDGGAGADAMAGGAGWDTYVVDQAGDTVTESAGQGRDTVRSGVDRTLSDHVEDLNLTGSQDLAGTGNALNNRITGNGGANALSGEGGHDTIRAGGDADTVSGGSGNDRLYGQADTDTLQGGGGDDTLDGGSGADAMAGGTGNDTYVVDDAGDRVTEAADSGHDTVRASVTETLSAHVEDLNLTGSADIDGTGNGLDNRITGNSAANELRGLGGDDHLLGRGGSDALYGGMGADRLDGDGGADTLYGGTGDDDLEGGSGADRMEGGAGDDTYRVDHSGDEAVEAAGSGTDTVFARASYTLGAHVENLNLEEWRNFDCTGNGLANELVGNRGSNTLEGLAGADTLRGGRGSDRLDGGSGADDLFGGRGDDTYVVAEAGDRVVEEAGAGRDTVESSIGYTLTDHVEDLTLIGSEGLAGTGNALDNRITGNSGNNTLDGGTGADTLAGGEGGDTYIVDASADRIVEMAGAGADTVRASADYVLNNHVENLSLTGDGDLDGTGNDLANALTGNDGANVLKGRAGDDVIRAEAGNDTLRGGRGTDGLYGGNGKDRLYGGSGADHLHGGAGNDLLEGGNGRDTLLTNAGDDVLKGGEGQDNYVYELGAGTATIVDSGDGNTLTFGAGIASEDISLSAHPFELRVAGGGAVRIEDFDPQDPFANTPIDTFRFADGTELSYGDLLDRGFDLFGTESDDVIKGTAVEDRIHGLAGDDTLIGRAGDDRLFGGPGADRLEGGAGFDTAEYVGSSTGVKVDLAAGKGEGGLADGDTLQSVEALVGSDHADSLFGDGRANRLEGGAGDDRLSGRGGPDQLIGGRGADTVTYRGGPSGVEVDLAAGTGKGGFAAGDSLTGIENATGTAFGDGLFGTRASNTLMGSKGDDLLVGRQGGDRLVGGAGTDTAGYADSRAGVRVNLATGEAAGGSAQGDVLSGIEGVTGSAHGDRLFGDGGANPLKGLAGSDRLYGMGGDDTLAGGAGSDRLFGAAGDDTLAGGRGSDVLFGGRGSDTASYAKASEGVTVNLACGYAHQASGTDLLFGMENVRGSAFDDTLRGDWGANRLAGGAGDDRLRGGWGSDTLVGGSGTDTADYRDSWRGVSVDLGAGTASGGTAEGDTLIGIEAVAGTFRSDSLIGDDRANTLSGDYGFDHLEGGGGADLLNGGRHHDRLAGGTGTDWLNGGRGRDHFRGGQGNDALLGGAHRDRMEGISGNDLLAGGEGSDALSIGGSDVVLHNADEGRDRIEGLGRTNQLTLSLGGGTSLEDLSLSRRQDDLVLYTGGPGQGGRRFGSLFGGFRGGWDGLVLEDWYADGGSGQPDSVTLQMVTEATDCYDPNADSERLSQKLNRYDFNKIVEAYDQAKGGKGRRWEAMDAALDNHLASSDSEALGGELAYRYGLKGSLDGASRQTVLATLTDERFGEKPQSLQGAGNG
ncbi:hypothetical protein [Thiohalorhabdus methylotrophus]|uniref:Ca2+-binding RTX toxin-like protein n=1 Tax=Thiohalorhabdus methylotrophus TaxID=3242694 RepID=A0ABV4TWB8_9GAMM